MHRRLQVFLPIVLLTLVMQILAPIAACWATTLALADPLQSAGICHSDATSGPGDQDRERYAHNGLCAVCVTHAGTAIEAPKPLAITYLARQFQPIVWINAELACSSSRVGSNAQARASPSLA